MIGIIVAEEKELCELLKITNIKNNKNIINKNFYIGSIKNTDVVIVKSNVGKVNSAMVTQMLIDNFNIKLVINIGTAGSVDNILNIGDIVIADKVYQYDFDVIPFGRKLGEIENIGPYIKINSDLINKFKCLNDVVIGGVATGDKFIVDINDKKFIQNKFQVLCVEMESASVAQVCYLNEVQVLIIRAISDKLDGSSKTDFVEFLEYSSKRCAEILEKVIDKLL